MVFAVNATPQASGLTRESILGWFSHNSARRPWETGSRSRESRSLFGMARDDHFGGST